MRFLGSGDDDVDQLVKRSTDSAWSCCGRREKSLEIGERSGVGRAL